MKRAIKAAEQLTIEDCERVCGSPEIWRGRCYFVALSLVTEGLVDGEQVSGWYCGPIDPEGYWGRAAGIGHAIDLHRGGKGRTLVRHGWVSLADGRILDPTRWVFTNEKPFIYISEGDDPDYEEQRRWKWINGSGR